MVVKLGDVINADGNDHNCECSACAERYAEIKRLRAILRRCVKGVDMVDLGDEFIGLHLPKRPLYIADR